MMKGGHGQTNQLHASHAPQLMSCNYCVYLQTHACTHTNTRAHTATLSV